MLQSSFSLYVITVLIWGSTFFAIKLQLDVVDPIVSVAYRFAIAVVVLVAWCLIRRKDMHYTPRDHVWMATQGFFLFSANYIFIYLATEQLTSGLVAVVFSTIVGWNIVLGRLFFATPITAQMIGGAVLGLGGLALVFWPEITNVSLTDRAAQGLALSLFGTILASLGNMSSARNQFRGLPVLQVNAFAMAYGAAFTFFYAFWNGVPFTWDNSIAYISSLLYLAIFGSVIAFGTYLTLLGRIGAGRAAYATVLFPVVALSLSVVMESYAFHHLSVIGAGLVLLGNVLVLAKPRHFQWLTRK